VTRPPGVRINTAVRQVARSRGPAASACFEHGFFEALAATRRAWSHHPASARPYVVLSGTKRPSRSSQFPGDRVAAMAVSLAIIGWCLVGFARKRGQGFALLCILANPRRRRHRIHPLLPRDLRLRHEDPSSSRLVATGPARALGSRPWRTLALQSCSDRDVLAPGVRSPSGATSLG